MSYNVLDDLRVDIDTLDTIRNKFREGTMDTEEASRRVRIFRTELGVYEGKIRTTRFANPEDRQIGESLVLNFKSSLEALENAIKQRAGRRRRRTRKNGKKRATRRKQRR